MTDYASSFNAAMAAVGLPAHGNILVDDKIHRFRAPPDKEANSWYVLHRAGDVVVGAFGCWKRQLSQPFCSVDRNSLDPVARKNVDQAIRDAKAIQQAEEKANYDRVRKQCAELLSRAPRAKEHAYLTKKGVGASATTAISTLELYPGWLAVPLQDWDGVIHSAQFIAEDGTKRYSYEGRVRGCFHQFADVNHDGPVIICEGYATGASLYEATGWTTLCAMTCGNLEAVAGDCRKRNPDRTILIAADNDQFTPGNPGVTHANKAAKSARCLVAIPEFADEALAEKPTDFNDLHRMEGTAAVKLQVWKAMPTLRVLSERLFNPNIQPPPIRPIYWLKDTIICTPANMSAITSAVKTGKTSAVCAMMASAFTHDPDCDLLGFRSENPKFHAIIHIDSEQSPDDHWYQVHRMLKRVGMQSPPPWFYSYCLTGLSHADRLKCFLEAMRIAREEHGGVHSAILDGIADFVADVNDPAECNDFVAKIHDTAIRFDAHINGVIHFNPGTEKTRGHLGSQFERKSETNLRLDKVGDTTTIWSEKQRRSPILRHSGPSFQWDDELEMHASCDSLPKSESRAGRKSQVEQIATMNSSEFIAGCQPGGESRTDAAKRLESWLNSVNMDVSTRTCYRAIEFLVGNGKLRKSDSLYFKGQNA